MRPEDVVYRLWKKYKVREMSDEMRAEANTILADMRYDLENYPDDWDEIILDAKLALSELRDTGDVKLQKAK